MYRFLKKKILWLSFPNYVQFHQKKLEQSWKQYEQEC